MLHDTLWIENSFGAAVSKLIFLLRHGLGRRGRARSGRAGIAVTLCLHGATPLIQPGCRDGASGPSGSVMRCQAFVSPSTFSAARA